MRLALLLAMLQFVVYVPTVLAARRTRMHVLAIGYNGTPTSAEGSTLRELRYADDDAAAFARLARDLGGHAIVLSTFDADTSRRFPDLAQHVRPPLLAELRRAVRELNASFEQDRRLGLEPQVLVTYSGHGVVAPGQAPALVLSDGELTQELLYNDVLSALNASYVHLVVDACHAGSVVRPRDAQGEIVQVTSDDARTALSKLTLRGLPQVGSMIAGSAGGADP